MLEKSKFLSQGTYGCVYRPGPKCKPTNNGNDYITKIQRKTITREVTLGKKITSLDKNYGDFFAPIIDNCDVDISVIDTTEMKKCDVLMNKEKGSEFESNIIPYVGKYTLAEYFEMLIVKRNESKNFLMRFLESYMVLLKALQKLKSYEIIHFDLKENNIMCRENRPIIIDFGISFDTVQTPLEEAFFTYAPYYPVWCIDISIISYVIKKLDKTTQEGIISQLEIEKIISEYITTNIAIKSLLSDQEKQDFKTKLQTYFKTFENITWKALCDEMLKYKFTWDSYSLAIIYLSLMRDLTLENYVGMNKFKVVLKSIVLSMPDKREIPGDIEKRVLEQVANITRSENKKLEADLKVDFKNTETNKNRRKQIANSALEHFESEKQIYNVLQ